MQQHASETDIFYDIPFFVSIVSVERRTPEQAAAEFELQYRKCGIRHFAVSFPIQPQGREPMKKIAGYVEAFRALQMCRKNQDIKIGILLQQTIGHNAVWNPAFDKELEWQRTVRSNGETSVRFCPAGEEFRRYISEAVMALTREKPDFLIVDDDARLDIRADKGVCECFCPVHTALFNEKYGTDYTPEELREAVSSAEDHAPLLWQFIDAASETLADYMRLLRQSADRIAPGIPMMLCGNSGNAGKKGGWAKILAGENHPAMLRIGNGSYMENAPRAITQRFAATAAQKFTEPADVLLLDEADTCPHNCYSKSARTMHLHIAVGLLNGLDGAKLWITDMRHYDPEITAPYAEILEKYRNFYPVLHQSVKSIAWQGALVSIPHPEALPHPEQPKWWRHGMWVTSYLSLFGLPFRYGSAGAGGLHLLSGNDPDGFSDAELDRMLSEAALIDSAAAAKLIERGFSEKIGVKEIRKLTLPVSGEEIVENNLFLRASVKNDSILIPTDNARILTRLLFRNSEPVPGAVRLQNVIVTAWRVDWDCRIDLQPNRKKLLTWLLSTLPGGVPARFESNSDATFRYGRGEEYDLAAVVNYGYDPLEKLLFEFPGKPEVIQQLMPDGSWKDTGFSEKDGIFQIPVRLECAELAVFRIINLNSK